MDKPDTTKETVRGGSSKHFRYGASAMQGWRSDMEDFHISDLLPMNRHGLFCVLDGHGGTEASRFGSQELTRILSDNEDWQTYCQIMTPFLSGGKSPTNKTIKDMTNLLKKALIQSFVELDRELYLEIHGEEEVAVSSAGSTAVAVLLTPFTVLCANLGDSRCVLASSSASAPTSIRPYPLSEDHKPYLPAEEERIKQAGGEVLEDRVDGELAVSRAIGDFELKHVSGMLYMDDYDPSDPNDVEQLLDRAQKQKVSAYPEVRVHQREDNTDRFLVLACDGIWDVSSNEDCVEWITEMFQQGQDDLGVVCEQIMDICLQKGSEDNMSIIVVLLEGGMKLIKK